MRVVFGSEITAKVEPPATIRQYMSPDAGMANLSITEVALPSGSATADHMHDTDQIVYVLDGEALFVGSNGDQHRLRGGDVIYIPAGEVHRHECAGDETLRQLAIFVTSASTGARQSQAG